MELIFQFLIISMVVVWCFMGLGLARLLTLVFG